jgi:hypothetical protein
MAGALGARSSRGGSSTGGSAGGGGGKGGSKGGRGGGKSARKTSFKFSVRNGVRYSFGGKYSLYNSAKGRRTRRAIATSEARARALAKVGV